MIFYKSQHGFNTFLLSVKFGTNLGVDTCINVQRESRSLGLPGRTAYRLCY